MKGLNVRQTGFPDPDSAALLSERKLMLPIQIEIAAFQKRAARATARRQTGQLLDMQIASDALSMLADEMAELASEIELLMDGQTGLGPAAECRDALHQISISVPTPNRKKAS